MSQSFSFKRGTTFNVDATYSPAPGQPADLRGLTVTSQVRTQAGALVADLAITFTDDFLGFNMKAPDGTAAWPVGVLLWDMKLEMADATSYTETVKIVVVQEVTA